MDMLQDHLREESHRITGEINATIASCRTHYNDPQLNSYNITDAINSLATVVQRTKENKQAELNKKFNSIMQAHRAVMLIGFPPHVQVPAYAVRPRPQPKPQNDCDIRTQNSVNRNQDLGVCRRGTWHPTHGQDRPRYNPASQTYPKKPL